MQKKIPSIHDKKSAIRKESNHGAQSTCDSMEFSEHFGLYKEFIEKETDVSGILFAVLQIYISNMHFNSTKDIQTDTYTEKYTKL